MEENKKEGMCESCHEHMCMRCWWGKSRLGRWIVALLLLAFVFWCGVKIGELKSRFETQWGYGYGSNAPVMMRTWSSNGTAPGWNMMWGWDQSASSSSQ
ncbi:MAG: hypothetical protein KGI60_00920 [Patescibacteria group bacterium]|nr:hypothetical protein [Patescibacteria group bacterium]